MTDDDRKARIESVAAYYDGRPVKDSFVFPNSVNARTTCDTVRSEFPGIHWILKDNTLAFHEPCPSCDGGRSGTPCLLCHGREVTTLAKAQQHRRGLS